MLMAANSHHQALEALQADCKAKLDEKTSECSSLVASLTREKDLKVSAAVAECNAKLEALSQETARKLLEERRLC